MKASLNSRDIFLSVSIRPRYSGRLPTDNLPFAVALKESAGVEKVRDLDGSALVSRANQAKRDYGGLPVLLNANVFGSVSGLRIFGFGRGSRAHITHDVRLVSP